MYVWGHMVCVGVLLNSHLSSCPSIILIDTGPLALSDVAIPTSRYSAFFHVCYVFVSLPFRRGYLALPFPGVRDHSHELRLSPLSLWSARWLG